MEDGVTDELAGTVVGDVAAARGLVEAYALRLQDLRRGEEMAGIAAAAEGDDGRMLEQQQLIVDLVALPQFDEFLLQPHPVLVGDEMEVAKVARAHRLATADGARGAFPHSVS